LPYILQPIFTKVLRRQVLDLQWTEFTSFEVPPSALHTPNPQILKR
jgi:hypothetical protein